MPPPLSTEISIVSQSVTVCHLEGLSPTLVRATLLDAGFDIAEATLEEQHGHPSLITGRSQKHIDQCLLCQEKQLLSSDFQDPNPHPQEDVSIKQHMVALSVGGMTCSSCSNTVTDMVSIIQGVSHTSVNLIDGSATVIVDSLALVDIVREAIENCGFEAEIVNVDPINTGSERKAHETTRVISLRVDGMFCQSVISRY